MNVGLILEKDLKKRLKKHFFYKAQNLLKKRASKQ